jgi:amino acid transporter
MVFLGLGFFELLFIGVWIFAVIDVLVTPAEQVRNLPKIIWLLITIIAFNGIGAALWFLFGRPRAAVGQRAAVGSSAGRGAGPDDDIDFLRSLDRKPDGPN